MCSISRIHVVWKTSAASLSTSLKSLVIDQMSRPYLPTRPPHAGGSPWAAPRTSLVASWSAKSEPTCLKPPTADPSKPWRGISGLVGTRPPEDHWERLPQDLYVESERTVLDIAQVEAYCFLPRQLGSTVHLPHAGQTRLHDEAPADIIAVLRYLL